jgi:hypothetical protein
MTLMTERAPFAIEIGEPYTADSFAAPEDPLGELSEEELKFRQFCFEHNRLVNVRVGTKEKIIFLFPDVALAYQQLWEAPRQLRQGVGCSVSFPDSGFDLVFEPKSSGVECRLEEFGYQRGISTCLCSLADIEGAVTRFTDNVLACAVNAGYLTSTT